MCMIAETVIVAGGRRLCVAAAGAIAGHALHSPRIAVSSLSISRETPSAVHRRGTRVQSRFAPHEWAAVEQPTDPALAAWITDLHGRLERDELANATPFDLGDGTGGWPAALTVRIMLADLNHYAMLEPVQRLQPAVGARRLALLDDFRRLREVLG
jgi:hypothetical protein